jgi:cell division septal protein FtsQ
MRYNPQKHRRKQRHSRLHIAAAERAERTAQRLPTVRPALIGMLAIAVFALIAVAWFNGPAWRVETINVRNNEGVPVEQIIGASGLQGEHYQFVDLQGAAGRIDELPGVEGAEVTCSWFWTTSCQITVQPAQPLALIQSAARNINVWTDFEGKVQRAPQQMNARLQVRMEDGEPPPIGVPLDPELLRALTELSANPAGATRLLYSQTYGLMVENERGVRYRLGVAESEGAILEKLRLANTLAEQLGSKGVQPRIIDVRYLKAPYYVK